MVGFHTAAGDETTWDLEEIYEVANTIFPVSKEIRKKLNELESLAGDASADELARTKIVDYLFKQAVLAYDAHEKGLIEQAKRLNNAEPEKIMSQVERTVLLRAIDNHWVQHLTAIDHLRAGIGLRGYGQREPLVEYKRESYKMYNDLLGLIRNSVVYSVYKTQLSGAPVQPAQRQLNELGPSKTSTAQSMMMGAATSTAAPMGKLKDSSGHKVGRNNPCPCGATLPDGRPKKYKHCHGKNV